MWIPYWFVSNCIVLWTFSVLFVLKPESAMLLDQWVVCLNRGWLAEAHGPPRWKLSQNSSQTSQKPNFFNPSHALLTVCVVYCCVIRNTHRQNRRSRQIPFAEEQFANIWAHLCNHIILSQPYYFSFITWTRNKTETRTGHISLYHDSISATRSQLLKGLLYTHRKSVKLLWSV